MKLSQVPKFSKVAKGTRAIHVVTLPLVNTPGELLPDQPELAAQREANGTAERSEIRVGMRVLTPGEAGEVYEGTYEFARQRKLAADDRGDLYALGYTLNLLARCCVDAEPVDEAGNPLPLNAEDPEPFFGQRGNVQSAIDEMMSCEHLTRDSLLFLAEHYGAWEDMISPQASKISPEKLWEIAGEVVASTDASPFLRLRPAMQFRFVQFLAASWRAALTSNLPPDSGSSESSSSGSPSTTTAG